MLTEAFPLLGGYVTAFLTALLLASAVHKALDRPRMVAAVTSLSGLSGAAAWTMLAVAGLIELATGLGLLLPAARLGAALAAGALWTGYLLLLVRALRRGDRIDCGCTFGRRRSGAGGGQVRRNLTLVALSLFVADATAVAAPAVIGVSEALAGLAFLTLYMAADQIAGLVPAGGGR
jgi:hypothetical protein